MAMPQRDGDIETRVTRLIETFSDCLLAFEQHTPFSVYQRDCHRRTLALRLSFSSAADALASLAFLETLYRTLQSWGIGQRGSKLVAFDQFTQTMTAHAPDIAQFQTLTLSDEIDADDLARRLWNVIDGLGIVKNEATIVAGTKTLYHILPKLIVPIDRAYTGLFFGWYPPEFQNGSRVFRRTFRQFVRIAQQIDLEQFVGQGWNTSITKVIDNAMIGFCQALKAGVAKGSA